MTIDAPYRARLAACGLGTPGEALDRVDGRVVAWSRSTDVVFIECRDGGPGFYLKRYRYAQWDRRLRGMLRGTLLGRHRGEHEYRLLARMQRLGLPVVRPVAYGMRRRWGFIEASFLITEAAPDAENLTTVGTAVRDGAMRMGPAERMEVARQLAGVVARMHETGFSHGQLFWRNIVMRRDAHAGVEFFFLDARPRRGARRLSRRGVWWRDELAQLAASATPFVNRSDGLRFLQAYCRIRSPQLDPRELYRCCVRMAHRYAPHEERRIRMNTRFQLWNRQLSAQTAGADA
ncbi:MAG: hypothetical protein D6744_05040 [Planctomycetota bacterium]|nr:MAG: hypothetical protein D6744_05040 [Planctomycetota bacterium]